MSEITPSIISAHGLTLEEYKKIVSLLGRTPNLTELGIFAVMWSEHCSYKSSRVYLKTLPTQSKRVIQGPGENAGVIDIGGEWCIVFKVESHNHPSFIEPFQGAATGVGGILRDIFTMGARPIAILNSLHFGPLNDTTTGAHNRAICDGVVRGIAHYGNSFGCPTIGGEVYFDNCYSQNPLVNAFALGIARKDQIFLGKATGIGNPVIYVGAMTGRDGIHGATMASSEFDETTQSKRPTVQVADPFRGKLLLEACLEAMKTGCVVGIQDMGAAGLTSSSCEMGSRAGTGIDIDVSLVPQRAKNMSTYEIMLSESQERMLLVVTAGREREIQEIFARWELPAVVIGQVTNGNNLRVRHNREVIVDIPNTLLTSKAPYYKRPLRTPDNWEHSAKLRISKAQQELDKFLPKEERELSPEQVKNTLIKLLQSSNLSSREWIYQQYDYMVRTNTLLMPGHDAAVVKIKETRKALAMSLDSNSKYCSIDPYQGAQLLVAEGCRNLVAVGATPIGLTNCLNFASPEHPEIMWAFKETIRGMGKAARKFEIPIVSGNVSFYNETQGEGIYHTPTIGSVGLIDDIKYLINNNSVADQDILVLLGVTKEDLGASEYVRLFSEKLIGPLPKFSYKNEQALHKIVLQSAKLGILTGAHDLSDGGLLIALAEYVFKNEKNLGARVKLKRKGKQASLSLAGLLFGETPSRMIVTINKENLEKLHEIVTKNSFFMTVLGEITEGKLSIEIDGVTALNESVTDLYSIWNNAFEEAINEI